MKADFGLQGMHGKPFSNQDSPRSITGAGTLGGGVIEVGAADGACYGLGEIDEPLIADGGGNRVVGEVELGEVPATGQVQFSQALIEKKQVAEVGEIAGAVDGADPLVSQSMATLAPRVVRFE